MTCHISKEWVWDWLRLCDPDTNIRIISVRLGNNPDLILVFVSESQMIRSYSILILMKWSFVSESCVHIICYHIRHVIYVIYDDIYVYVMSYDIWHHIWYMTISYVMIMSLLLKGMSMRLSHICHIWCHMWHVMSYDHLICDDYERIWLCDWLRLCDPDTNTNIGIRSIRLGNNSDPDICIRITQSKSITYSFLS